MEVVVFGFKTSDDSEIYRKDFFEKTHLSVSMLLLVAQLICNNLITQINWLVFNNQREVSGLTC